MGTTGTASAFVAGVTVGSIPRIDKNGAVFTAPPVGVDADGNACAASATTAGVDASSSTRDVRSSQAMACAPDNVAMMLLATIENFSHAERRDARARRDFEAGGMVAF